jgi:hypothetical protein
MALKLHWYDGWMGINSPNEFSTYACHDKQPAIWVHGRIRDGGRYDLAWSFKGRSGVEQSLEAVEDQVIPMIVALRMTS